MKCAAISVILTIALAQSAIAITYRGQCRDTGNRCSESLKALVQVENK
jgi:hypothetical protein